MEKFVFAHQSFCRCRNSVSAGISLCPAFQMTFPTEEEVQQIGECCISDENTQTHPCGTFPHRICTYTSCMLCLVLCFLCASLNNRLHIILQGHCVILLKSNSTDPMAFTVFHYNDILLELHRHPVC
uniref:Uncharacterized protein n=1 Tax=Physcomitrium patens TaxID=3218 RepID=A0A2K1KCG3_PHYPA|nr:hypothetical protein PHYPA_010662 [Physcomitrium patens]